MMWIAKQGFDKQTANNIEVIEIQFGLKSGA